MALIEAFLAYPVTQLQGIERLIMVIFMTSFPFFVAMGFFYILWHRPINLYNPGEIPSGLQNRYQPEIVKAIATEVQMKELQEQVQSIRSTTNIFAAQFGGSKIETNTVSKSSIQENVQETLKSIESQVADRFKSNQVIDKESIQKITADVQKERRDQKSTTISKIKVNISRFYTWLNKIGFKDTPEIKEVILDSTSPDYITAEKSKAIIGTSVTNEYDGILAASLSTFWVQKNIEYDDEGFSLIIAICEYYVCSYNNSPNFGEVFAKTVPSYPHRLNEFVSLNDDTEIDRKEARAWSNAFWELRMRYGQMVVDSSLADTIHMVNLKLTKVEIGTVFFNEIVKKVGGKSKGDISDIFKARGIDILK